MAVILTKLIKFLGGKRRSVMLLTVVLLAIVSALALASAHVDLLYIILAIIVYAAAGVVIILSARVAAKKLKGEDERDPILSNITLDFIYKLYLPVMICGEDGKIIWYNRAMSKAEGSDETLYDKHISEIGSSQLSLDRILGTRNEDGVFCTLDQTEYVVKGYKINSHNKTFTILIWEDRTQLNTIVREAFLHDPVEIGRAHV